MSLFIHRVIYFLSYHHANDRAYRDNFASFTFLASFKVLVSDRKRKSYRFEVHVPPSVATVNFSQFTSTVVIRVVLIFGRDVAKEVG